MSEVVPEGATLPDGIEVDEAAAYFGVTESSASLHTLLEMNSEQALCLFLEMTSDIHLAKGEFDFETASERMNCEGGEIYFLVAGHLGMMSFADPLRHWLGEETSDGEPGGPDPGIGQDAEILKALTDPMTILQILSIAHVEDGEAEVRKYLNNLKNLFSNPAGGVETLKMISTSLSAILHSYNESGNVAAIPGLADGTPPLPAAAPVSSPSMAAPTPAPKTTGVEPSGASKASTPPSAAPVIEPSVPLPGKAPQTEVSDPQAVSVPRQVIDEKPVPLPSGAVIEAPISPKDQKVESDAFAGAFGLSDSPPSTAVSSQSTTPSPSKGTGLPQDVGDWVGESVQNPVQQPEDSMEDMLSGITTSGYGSKQPEFGEQPISPQTETTPVDSPPQMPESSPLPQQAVEEPVVEQRQQVVEETVVERPQIPLQQTSSQALPTPVRAAPVRAPVGGGMPRPQAPTLGQQLEDQQMQAQQAALQQQMGGTQMPSHGQSEKYQPTIRSGVHCQGCGIGLDPSWNNCPVCGLRRL